MANSLHIAIKDCVHNYGIEVIKSTRLANILADYNAYEDVPASRQILREFLSDGYGSKVFDLYSQKLPWQKKLESFSKDFIKKHGYKESLVTYTLECLEYGLGWITQEPQYEPNAPVIPEGYTKGTYIPDMSRQLVLMQKEYTSMLEQLITIPKGGLYKKSGYYSASAQAQLWVVENKIEIIGAALGKDYTNWYTTEKQRVLDKYQQEKSKQISMVFVKVIVPIIIVTIAIIEGTTYLVSLDQIREYKSTFAHADSLFKIGDYSAAMGEYQRAGAEYSCNFSRTKLKKDANTASELSCEKIVELELNKYASFLEAGKYFDAQKTLEFIDSLSSTPSGNKFSSFLSSKQSEFEETVKSALYDGKSELIQNIANHNGRLDTTGIELLVELLKVAPEDYWLNFIKTKEKIQ